MSLRNKVRSVSHQDVWGRGDDWKDIRLTSAEAALGVSAVLSSVDLIASRVQMMDFDEVMDGADGVDDVQPIGEFLRAPSGTLAPDEWVYQAAASYLLFGRLIGLVTSRDHLNLPSGVEWLNPDRVTYRQVGGRVAWFNQGVEVDRADLLIRRWAPMIPGDLTGVAPVAKLHVDIQRGLKAALYERDFFEANGLPLAVLQNTEQNIDEPMARAVAGRYDDARRSRGRRPLVIGKQWTLTGLKSSPTESGIDSVEKRIATKVATVFHVPPEWVGGESGGSLTYDNPEMNTRLLDGMALQPVYTMLERLISATCLPARRRLRFRPDSILRSDPKVQAEIDEHLIRTGLVTVNERRRARGLRPLQDGQGQLALWPPYSTSMPRQGGEP
jgi:HK97 family phage portal protein